MIESFSIWVNFGGHISEIKRIVIYIHGNSIRSDSRSKQHVSDDHLYVCVRCQSVTEGSILELAQRGQLTTYKGTSRSEFTEYLIQQAHSVLTNICWHVSMLLNWTNFVTRSAGGVNHPRWTVSVTTSINSARIPYSDLSIFRNPFAWMHFASLNLSFNGPADHVNHIIDVPASLGPNRYLLSNLYLSDSIELKIILRTLPRSKLASLWQYVHTCMLHRSVEIVSSEIVWSMISSKLN